MKIPWQERKKTITSQSLSLFFFLFLPCFGELHFSMSWFLLLFLSPQNMLKPKYVVA
jgi:hypothetical protein